MTARSARDSDAERWMLESAIGLLAGSRWFAALSLALAAAAAFTLAAGELVAPAARSAGASVVMLGVAAAYVGLRAELDLGILRALREDRPQLNAALASFDCALRSLGWIAEARAGRSLAERIPGLRRLTFAQGALALAQAIILALLPWLR